MNISLIKNESLNLTESSENNTLENNSTNLNNSTSLGKITGAAISSEGISSLKNIIIAFGIGIIIIVIGYIFIRKRN